MATAGCVASKTPASPAAAPGTRRGGKISVGIAEPSSVDPATATDASGSLIVRTMCDPLIQLDPLTGALRPALAKSWGIFDSGRRFSVRLRRGVTFSDGSEVTADDAVFTLWRVASEGLASPLAGLLQPIEGFQAVHGDVRLNDANRRDHLSGLKVIDKYTFEISIGGEQADFLRLLSHPLASPVKRSAARKNLFDFAHRPVCAGPYVLDSPWQPGAPNVRLVRSRSYSAKNAAYTAGGRGYADTIDFRVVGDRAGELNQFGSGTLDVAHAPLTGVEGSTVDESQLVRGASPLVEYLGLPVGKKPFYDPQVRVALSQALDRRQLAAHEEGGSAVPARGFLPPTLGPTYRPGACGAGAPETADVAGARATLANAHVSLTGQPVKLYFNDEFGRGRMVAEVARQWREAFGLDAELVPVPWTRYLQLGSGVGFDEPFRISWAAPIPSADSYLGALFDSSATAVANFGHFRDPLFDRALTYVARRSTVEKDSRVDYQKLEDLVCRRMPTIPLTIATTNILVNQAKLGLARTSGVDRTTGDAVLREVYLK